MTAPNESKVELNNRIIVVDDERDIVQSYVDLLSLEQTSPVRSSRSTPPGIIAAPAGSGPDFVILKAYSGTEAIEVMKKEIAAGHRISGGFFDMKMEGGPDGVQTIQEMWKLDPDLHCTIVTAYHDRSVRDIDHIFGPRFKDQWDYLNKPFTSGEILQKARQMVAAWNRRRKLLEAMDALKNAQAQLIRSERLAAIGQVARGIGHEFGNILQTIVGKADISLNTSDPEKIKKNLELIMTAADHAAFVVRNLQSFAKSEAIKTNLDLAKIVETTFALISHSLIKRNIEGKKQLAVGVTVHGSENELQQVLMNLVINAMDAMPKGGPLEVGCSAQERKALMWVRDAGTGITPEVLPHIFEYAYTTKGDKGSGLGLSISKQIIEAHGGKIKVTSELGKGTTFTIELPLGAT